MKTSTDISLCWLGQSGFLLGNSEIVFACDLYLSDFCQTKSRLDHTRLMPIPVMPDTLAEIDHYLITHGHIDHFDPETIGPVMKANKGTKFYCPPDCQRAINEYFPTNSKRFNIINSMREYDITADISLVAIPAAHEELEVDADGEYIAFSYLLLFKATKQAVFFGGDTIPYPQQIENLKQFLSADYALTLVLPVNGRDAERAELGFKGNLTLEEVVTFYNEINADLLVPCHFGMFALNDIKETMNNSFFQDNNINAVIPELNKKISLEKIK